VLVVAGDGDEHAKVVENELLRLGARFLRLDISNVQRFSFTSRPGTPLSIEGRQVGTGSTVWWRRPGSLDISGMAADEALLAEAEAWTIFEAVIRSSGARIIDPPWIIHQAEDKMYQLQCAQTLGLVIPDTLVTNSIAEARAFLNVGPIVAKATSSGPGLAPFVDEVTSDLVDLVTTLPVFLQRAVPADADLRLVTIGDQVSAWRRQRRAGDPWDWRAIDPSGLDFHAMSDAGIVWPAVRLAQVLGLTFSVQDWLDIQNDRIFLEVNPQGQWLFLEGAAESVAPLMAKHLFRQ